MDICPKYTPHIRQLFIDAIMNKLGGGKEYKIMFLDQSAYVVIDGKSHHVVWDDVGFKDGALDLIRFRPYEMRSTCTAYVTVITH